ncbi:hypothetical protein EUX98_g4062 [Antrodiella citrinella]|uniref:Phospholipid/glycerol acyltransferase domain-containing protein n=1 Tax=Antrodiella citrinella TaxID=2447956 RepID=A0A4V3XIR1_9APHY|nr:hypothetical protein EUX98_g4062 [Antrodiella citrinella]
MLRLTAKATQFGRGTFTSWLIESAGTVPLQRRKDSVNGETDNSEVMKKLLEALDIGDAVCLFPEGMSRYHPTIAPLKTGVARIVSDALSRNRDNPNFEVSVQTCSITYMHRQHFRSDVLVTFHEPMKFSAKLLAPVDFSNIRELTARLHKQISSGTLDAPSWRLIRDAKLAARMYAPLGTEMTLGDYVRIVRTFLEALKMAESRIDQEPSGSGDEGSNLGEEALAEDKKIVQLGADLKAYQDKLSRYGLKDDRIRRPLHRRTMAYRALVRLTWSIVLITLSIPGLLLWMPIFITTVIAVREFKRTGPVWDTYDEIAQYKLTYGFISGLCVYFGTVALTFPVAPLTVVLVPLAMWMSLRWFEDATAAFRACTALIRLLWVGPTELRNMQETRGELYKRVMDLAVHTLGLPEAPEKHFGETGGKEKGRVRGRWDRSAKYFSVRRRRKRDWNETLRLYDKVDYPEDY